MQTTYPKLRHAVMSAAVVSASALAFIGIPATTSTAAQTPAACANVALVNGSFETPTLAANTWTLFDESVVPGWETSATDNKLEFWRAPFQGVPVPAGSQFAEINANQRSKLFQDFATTPGETIRWQLQHRGRTGVDVMEVRIGDPAATLALQSTLSTGQSWVTYSGLYTVPAGQTTTRISFDSISSANGSPSYGNFVDDISVTSGACVVTTKSVTLPSGGSVVRLGDTVQYSIVATNQGASAAALSSLVDVLPAGVSFVPGSISVTSGASTTAVSDAGGDDTGEFDSGANAVRVRVGAGATSSAGGTLAAGASVTVSFSVIVNSITALPSIDNTATVSFTDSLSSTVKNSTSNTTSTTITPDAPALSIVTTGSVAPVENQSAANVGDEITWSYVVTNTGDVAVTGVTVNDPEGGTITCVPTTLAVGESASCTGTATRTVALADLGVGSVSNGATASATPPFGAAAVGSPESIATITTVAVAPAVSIITIGTVTPVDNQSAAALGNTVTWSYVVTNTGNVPLTELTVNDPEGGTITCVPSDLAVGETANCTGTATHSVSPDDLANGSISNGATVSATPPFGAAPIESSESIATVTTAALEPSISVVVEHDNVTAPGSTDPAVAGDQIRARFVITNTGNSILTHVHIVDPVFGDVTCVDETLDPGESTTCVADELYTVTDDDAAAGTISRTISAAGLAVVGVVGTSVSDQQLVDLEVAFDLPTLALPDDELGLAATGADIVAPASLAVALMALGLGALAAARVRRLRAETRAR
ncbi:hypothetical protein [Microcella sp.]|uniref:DUF7507 domain-containing protein n=1 Tax=Microcella sp. TaxID=1913979 RepID=UPI00299F6B7D|nr:hypothetical protein [Microcella sp.]MDX2026969.1 hypothetical protein [Microcella sp.]